MAGASAAWAGDHFSQADLLRRLIDLERLTVPPPPGERTGMFSGVAGREERGGSVRAEPGGWDVLAEMPGPGAITRIWSSDPNGQLRIVVDEQVAIDAPFADLFNGKMPPFGEPLCYETRPGGGRNCYLPMGYARSCRVLARGSRSTYQINAVTFPPGTSVDAFRPELDASARAALDEVSAVLTEPLSEKRLIGGRSIRMVASQDELEKGEKLTASVEGAGTIRILYVSLTERSLPRDTYALHRCVLRLHWDGQERPSVEAPLVDFFGSGFGRAPYSSLVMGTDLWTSMPAEFAGGAQFMYCAFPMPFGDGARLEIENTHASFRPIGLMVQLYVDRAMPAESSLRFHARFRKEDPCRDPQYTILEASGAGYLVGCTLNVDCPRADGWGDGAERIWINGERTPSYLGTGTADYFGDAPGLGGHGRAFQGVTRRGAYGKSSAYRWHIAEAIGFQRSIRFGLENRQGDEARDTYYGSVVYWYAPPESKDFFKPLRAGDLEPPGLRIPGSVEIEGHVRGSGWGNLIKQSYEERKYAGGLELSGQAAAILTTTQPVAIEIPSSEARRVLLKLRMHPRRPFEKVEVLDAAGQLVGTVVYDRDRRDGIYEVGPAHLNAGGNVLNVRTNSSAVLDCWVLEAIEDE